MEVEGPSRRPRQAVGEAGDSSSSIRKRPRYVEEEEDDDSEEEEEEELSERDQPPQRMAVSLDDSDDDFDLPISLPRRVAHHRCSTTPAPVPPPPSSSCSESSAVRDVTVNNSSALDCGICFLPLKPPIFQCIFGHAVCSPCHDKLGVPRSSCHVCRALTPGGYRRCHALEQLVDSIHVPCPHAAHGCTDRPVYHSRQGHAKACVHAPCHCPGKACSFVGSTVALARHFANEHRWSCTTDDNKAAGTTGFDIKLRDGFNFVTSNQHLFLLNVERAPFGRTITAFCIHHHHTKTAKLRLSYYCYRSALHSQSSEFKVACTDLSNGLPDPSNSFLFIVSRSALSDEEFTKVTVVIMETPI